MSTSSVCPICQSPYTGIYTELPAADVERLAPHQSCELYKKGSSFFHEGSRPNGVFFIHRGKVKIYKHGDGREQIIKIAKEGEMLGYRAILAEEQFPVSAKTLEDCRLCFIPKPVFLDAVHASPVFTQKILKEACRELDFMTEVLTHMAQKTVRERLAHTLSILGETYREKGRKESVINLKREDLAGLVGTATETLIRLLAEFKESGVIQVEGRKIVIKDNSGLKKFAKIF